MPVVVVGDVVLLPVVGVVVVPVRYAREQMCRVLCVCRVMLSCDVLM